MIVLAAGERIGDWIVVEALGEGGMGAVYRCRNALSDRIEAAVKIVKPHSLQDETERFIREVEALDAVRHPAVVRIKGWGEDEQRGLLWLAMDLVRGEDLEKRLTRGPLPPDEARRVFTIVADALRHAHAKGIFHRDIKPANLIISTDGSPWIVDFGIAVQSGRTRLTTRGEVPGTPAYMAPEIFSGDVRPDPAKVDVYALGQVLYEALSGRHAYPQTSDSLSTGQRLVQLMGLKLRAEALDPGEGIPEDLRDVVRRATEPDPDDRLADMTAMHAALRAGGGGVPPERSLPPAPSTFVAQPPPRRTGRRIGLVLLLAALAIGVLAVGAIAIVAVAAGIGWTVLKEDTGGQPFVGRDVRVVVTGLAGGTPTRVILDGRGPDRSDGGNFDFLDVPPGDHAAAVISGAGCDDVRAADGCPACCGCASHPLTVTAGAGRQMVALAGVPAPAAAPRDVRVTVPNVGNPWNVRIDLGGAAGPHGKRVDARAKEYGDVPPGTYTLRVDAGRCEAGAVGCWPDGHCPDGCASWQGQIEIPCGTGPFVYTSDLPTPQGVPPEVAVRTGGAAPGAALPSAFGDDRFTGASLPSGTAVTVLDVHPDDAYYGNRSQLVGQQCQTTGVLNSTGPGWMAGPVYCAGLNRQLYFYKVAVRR